MTDARRDKSLRDDVMSIAKELVDRVTSGEITSISAAVLLSDGECESIASATDQRIEMIGAVSLLLRDIMRG